MKSLSSLLPSRPQQHADADTQWRSLLQRFMDSYNGGVTEEKYKKKIGYFMMRLSPILKREGIEYLEYFYNECTKKESFGKFFNWSLSTKNSHG